MSAHFDDLIAVTSGTAVRVAGWSSLLRAECIQDVTELCCQTPDGDTPDHLELWVHKDDVGRVPGS